MERSYSYAGEDVVAYNVLGDVVGSYVDVGANHPTKANNTYFFYARGWNGVCVEPLRVVCDKLRATRPRDLHLNFAASDHDGTRTLYEPWGASALATLSPEVARGLERDGYKIKTYEVEVRTLTSLAKEWNIRPPDLLSIDVEGHEKEVLGATPFDFWRPRVIIIEATAPRTMIPTESAWEPALLDRGYRLHAIVGINRVYVSS